MAEIDIKTRIIGDNNPLYFIADIGANHDGSIERAFNLIELAKHAGATAVKFQNFQAQKIVSKYGFENLGSQSAHQAKWKKSVFEVYQDASISFDWTQKLKEKCESLNIDYFTSPYDFESVDKVDPFVDLYKIGSGDITWIEIIQYIAKKGKPVLIATGASTIKDVERAVLACKEFNNKIVLMQCNTNYTADIENFNYVNLNVLKQFKLNYPDLVLGLSDHTPGHATVAGAVALGATVFEKHFTDDNDREGPDHKFAMNPQTWKEMVDVANQVKAALGDGIKRVEENEKQSLIVQQRCLRAKNYLPKGHIIKSEDVEALRPFPTDGFAPYEIKNILGKKLVKDIQNGEHFTNQNTQI